MNAQAWRAPDDISVEFDEEECQGDGRVIEFSTWCEGEYCEAVHVSTQRASELLTCLVQALQRARNGAGTAPAQSLESSESDSRLIWIEARWNDCHVVHVEPPERFRMLSPDDPHALGYWMRHTSRAEALRCAIRESSQWLIWSVENRALDVGQQFANLSALFMGQAEREPIDPF